MTQTILITGANGWLGQFIVQECKNRKHKITELTRTKPHPTLLNYTPKKTVNISADLAVEVPSLIGHFDQIIHCAGHAHLVPKTEAEAQQFYDVNVQGTKNLLSALEKLQALPSVFVFISSVAVYGLTTGKNITENQPRNAQDPYGKSKIQAEDLCLEWGQKHGVRITIIRPPLVAGPAAPGNLGAMIQALKTHRYLSINHGSAQRSVVCADDLAIGILDLAAYEGIFHLTDGEHPSFRALEKAFCEALEVRQPFHISLGIAKILAQLGQLGERLLQHELPFNAHRLEKMTSTLTFSNQKATRTLNWAPSSLLSRAHWIIKETLPAPKNAL